MYRTAEAVNSYEGNDPGKKKTNSEMVKCRCQSETDLLDISTISIHCSKVNQSLTLDRMIHTHTGSTCQVSALHTQARLSHAAAALLTATACMFNKQTPLETTDNTFNQTF